VSSRRDALRTMGAGFVALFALGQADEALAAPSPGDPCKKRGRTRKVGGATLRCVSRGGSLVWARTGGAPAVVAPAPAPAIASASLVEGAPVVVVVTDQSGTRRYVGVSRSASGVAAFDPMCTHQGYLLEPRNGEWYCDYHGSRFAPASGDVLQGPASRPLRRYEVVERDGTVFVVV